MYKNIVMYNVRTICWCSCCLQPPAISVNKNKQSLDNNNRLETISASSHIKDKVLCGHFFKSKERFFGFWETFQTKREGLPSDGVDQNQDEDDDDTAQGDGDDDERPLKVVFLLTSFVFFLYRLQINKSAIIHILHNHSPSTRIQKER